MVTALIWKSHFSSTDLFFLQLYKVNTYFVQLRSYFCSPTFSFRINFQNYINKKSEKEFLLLPLDVTSQKSLHTFLGYQSMRGWLIWDRHMLVKVITCSFLWVFVVCTYFFFWWLWKVIDVQDHALTKKNHQLFY